MNLQDIIAQKEALITFIEPLYVKVHTTVSPNLNDGVIKTSIWQAQNQYTKSVLGLELYNKLLDLWITANKIPQNLPDAGQSIDGNDYRALYFACLDSLCWFSYYNIILNTGVKIDEKGVMTNNSDYSENGGIELIAMMQRNIKNIASEHQETLRRYILDNVVFEPAQGKCEASKPIDGLNGWSMFIPNNSKKNKYKKE